MAAAATFSCKRCSLVVPGMGTIQGFLGEEPGERDLGVRSALALSDGPQQVNQGPVRLAGLRREAGNGVTEIGAVE